MNDLDALEAAAKAATPGEWKASTISAAVYTENEKIGGDALVCEVRGYGYLTGKGHGGLGLPHNLAIKQQRDTAAFIALANPASVLEMVEEIRRGRDAESRRARLAEEYAEALNEIERLREALKPFADLPPYPPAHRKLLVVDTTGPYHLLQHDFDRTRAALESKHE